MPATSNVIEERVLPEVPSSFPIASRLQSKGFSFWWGGAKVGKASEEEIGEARKWLNRIIKKKEPVLFSHYYPPLLYTGHRRTGPPTQLNDNGIPVWKETATDFSWTGTSFNRQWGEYEENHGEKVINPYCDIVSYVKAATLETGLNIVLPAEIKEMIWEQTGYKQCDPDLFSSRNGRAKTDRMSMKIPRHVDGKLDFRRQYNEVVSRIIHYVYYKCKAISCENGGLYLHFSMPKWAKPTLEEECRFSNFFKNI
jgi:hypothetical protein